MTDTEVPLLRNPPVQARSRATLDTIRRAAIELYNDPEVGRDSITTQMVVDRTGLSVGTVYRYWRNRLAMLDDIAPDRDHTPIALDAGPGTE